VTTGNAPNNNDMNDMNRPADSEAVDPDDAQRRKVAHDFESLLLHQLFQTMRQTIPESDSEDCAADQVQSMYWSFLAQAVSDEGGIGLWKAVYDQMPKPAAASITDGQAAETAAKRSAAGADDSEAAGQTRLDERL